MLSTRTRLILWTGPKHCGKTTSAEKLTKIAQTEGLVVAGILQPSLYDNGELIGFDILDVQSQKRASLAKRKVNPNKSILFDFDADGLKFGNTILSAEATKSANLIIIDEFGPLELEGQGWRKNIDSLLSASNAIILIVVREELTNTVRQLYKNIPCSKLAATDGKSINKVITILKNHHQSQ